MNCNREYSSLCSLIENSLHQYRAKAVVSSIKEEKELMISLSQGLRQIKLWTSALDDDDDDDDFNNDPVTRLSESEDLSHSEHNCLTHILGVLMLFLGTENQIIRHLVGNLLGAVAEFVATSGSNWDGFIHYLCLGLELAISNSLSSSIDHPTEFNRSDLCSSMDDKSLKEKLKHANHYTAAEIARILRNILKYLKLDLDDCLLRIYFNNINDCLLNIPWDRLKINHLDQNVQSRYIYWGNILQLLCSFVGISGSPEAEACCLNEHPSVCQISNILPKILECCLGDKTNSHKTCLNLYFKHKILMLMMRLSFQINLDRTILESWLHLIHKYFQEFVSEPIIQPNTNQGDSLEGSPFSSALSGEQSKTISSRHLQRLAVFLFLRCSLCLVNPKVKTDPCACERHNSCLAFGQNSGPKCCSRKEGLLEIVKWLQIHLHSDTCLDRDMYLEKCAEFTLSFLKLYIHEDDILFKMLLQFVCLPFLSNQQICKEKGTYEVKDDVFSILSNLFHPIRLFHLFLAELRYDHQVLLDYLISKDIGTTCAEYLLKILRIIGDSWDIFTEFSFGGNMTNQPSVRKRKFEMDGGELKEVLPFKNAVDCLLSLKKSLESLHQKNLFPYNPQVLLRRLTRIDELCLRK